MACALGIEQDCSECRMCDKGKADKKITNYEKIKGMSVEELAEFIEKAKMCGALITRETTSEECCGCADGFCKDVLEWLENERDEE